MAVSLQVQCCIAGAGPAGMMLGHLLGRAGVSTLVLEKHADFLRDFRGDTVHPSTLRILDELGLLPEFLSMPHAELRALSAEVGGRSFKAVDFGRLAPPANFIALMPQWDFLNFLVRNSRRYPSLTIMMSAQVTGLSHADGRVNGVTVTTTDGPLEVRADLVVGCDGRSSTVRAASGLTVQDLGSPIDVLWFGLSKKASDPADVLIRLGTHKMLVTIDRNSYWQCAFVIRKGDIDEVHAKGLDAFKDDVLREAGFLADRMHELKSFDAIKLLSVSVDRLAKWSQPGLLCIGDAAHAMSPIGGVGINLAIQDAVATANILASKLKAGTLRDSDIEQVQQRRLFPVKVVQALQVAIQNNVLKPRIAGQGDMAVPWPLKVLNASAWARRLPAQFLGVGVRPERVRSPQG